MNLPLQKKPSPISILLILLLLVAVLHSVVCVEGVGVLEGFVFYRAGEG